MRYLDVINRGFSGYNTKNAVELLPQIFLPPSPSNPKIEYLVSDKICLLVLRPCCMFDVVTLADSNHCMLQLVLLGANDACLPIPTNTQGVPIDEYKENLVKIITHDHIKAHNAKILLVTPPPVDEIRITALDLAMGHPQATRQAAVSAAYSETARKVAADIPGVEIIDLHKAIMDEAISLTPDFDANGPALGCPGGKRGALEQLLPDGLHMSGKAYRVFLDIVKPHIGPFPARQAVFPDWRVMNPGTI